MPRGGFDTSLESIWDRLFDMGFACIELGIMQLYLTKIEFFFLGLVEFTYSQLMAKLLQLPKFLQLEIGKALVANASEGFEEDE